MKLYQLAFILPLPPEFLDLYGDEDIRPEGWKLEGNQLIYDFKEDGDVPTNKL